MEDERDMSTRDDMTAQGGSGAALASDRREHPRIVPDTRNQLAATLSSGSQVRLIDLSRGGAQFECERRFLPNASVTLRLITRDGEVPVTGRVVRSRIVRVASGGLGYRVGVAFASPLDTNLEDTPAADERQRGGRLGAAPEPSPEPATAPPATASPEVDPAPDTQTPVPAGPQPTPVETWADITAEEALAFEASTEPAAAALTLRVAVDSTSEQLQDMFDGNNW